MKKTEKMELYEKIIIAFHIVLLVFVFIGPLVLWITAPDTNYLFYQDCMKLRKQEGYPEDVSNEYCWGPSLGCEKKVYSATCNPELYCCFVNEEDDRKWNYLDYDEKGNKIRD